jgi:hypothetical protein
VIPNWGAAEIPEAARAFTCVNLFRGSDLDFSCLRPVSVRKRQNRCERPSRKHIDFAGLSSETVYRVFSRLTLFASLNAVVREAIAPRPIGTLRAGSSVRVVGAFLVWAADDAVGDHGRAGSVSVEEGQDLLAHGGILAHIQLAIGEPAFEKTRLVIFGEDDAHGALGSQLVGWPVEGHGRDGVAAKTRRRFVPQPRVGRWVSRVRQRFPSLHERNDTPIFSLESVRSSGVESRVCASLR